MDTYSEIYNRMKTTYEQESKCSFDEASDIAIRLKVLAGEIYNAQVNAEWLKKQMFVTTASGEYLDYLASQRGLARKQATKAQGEITFSVNEVKDHNIVIPKGTVVATADSEPLRFVTTEDEEIYTGNTLVSVYAEAEKAGKSGNIEINKAVVAVSVPSEIDSVTNRESFADGTDEETDDELRERIKNTFESPANGTNAVYYEQLALSVEGISKAGVIARARGAGTVNVYVCGNGVEAESESVAKAQLIMNENRELNVDVKVMQAELVAAPLGAEVTAKSGFLSDYVSAQCVQAFKNCINSIPMGGTLYLSNVGSCLMNTGCVENYSFYSYMNNIALSGAQCLKLGEVNIEVK